MDRGVVDRFHPGGEQPVQGGQAADVRGCLAGDLDQELVPDGPEEPFDLAPSLRLTGQSKIILWITGPGSGLSVAFSAAAFEAAELFFVPADVGGNGFEAAAQLVDLDGQAGQGGGVLAAGAALVDDGAQVGPPVKGGPADAGAGGDLAEGDGLPGCGQLSAGGLDPGQLAAVSWHGPG